jgi:hypothetical protein
VKKRAAKEFNHLKKKKKRAGCAEWELMIQCDALQKIQSLFFHIFDFHPRLYTTWAAVISFSRNILNFPCIFFFLFLSLWCPRKLRAALVWNETPCATTKNQNSTRTKKKQDLFLFVRSFST